MAVGFLSVGSVLLCPNSTATTGEWDPALDAVLYGIVARLPPGADCLTSHMVPSASWTRMVYGVPFGTNTSCIDFTGVANVNFTGRMLQGSTRTRRALE